MYRTSTCKGHSEVVETINIWKRASKIESSYSPIQWRSFGSMTWEYDVKKSICWCIMLIKIWIRLLWRHIFLRLSLWAFLAGPQLGLFMSWASENQKRKMDPIADFMKSYLANARGRIKGNAIVINSTWSICLRQNHSRPSTPHGSQDYSLAPHTPEESLKSGSPGKTV